MNKNSKHAALKALQRKIWQKRVYYWRIARADLLGYSSTI
jgi:hypothetical protein